MTFDTFVPTCVHKCVKHCQQGHLQALNTLSTRRLLLINTHSTRRLPVPLIKLKYTLYRVIFVSWTTQQSRHFLQRKSMTTSVHTHSSATRDLGGHAHATEHSHEN